MKCDDFTEAILIDPSQRGIRLVYADWLEERGQFLEAEFLRLTESLMDGEDAEKRKRIDEIVLDLDDDWFYSVADITVNFCNKHMGPEFGANQNLVTCSKTWKDLKPLKLPDKMYPCYFARVCEECKLEIWAWKRGK